MYGLLDAGQSATIATHQPAEATSATPEAASWASRRRTATGRGEQVHGREPGNHEERLQHLREEPEPDERAGEQQPSGLATLERPGERVGRGDEQQRQERVRVVEPEHQRGDRRRREDRARDQARGRREAAADGRVEQPDRGHAFERLRDEDAPGS